MAGIYLHIPFCKQKCRYCDFVSFCNRMDVAEAYMACLLKEIELRGKELSGRTFDTVYFGGGTPSVVDPKYIYAAMRQIKKCFRLSARPEVTIEVNPGTVSEQKIALYKRAGINRFSVGLQTAIDSQLEELGRIHTVRDYLYCTSLLRGENFSADVMLGIKGQTQDDVKKTIEIAAGSGAKHISMYALQPEDGTPVYTDYLNGELPDGDEVAALYDFGRELLAQKGYRRYEVSNFCRKGFESRHNLNYWKRGEYVGLGVSASSFVAGRRLLNTTDLDEYMKCILSGFFPVIDSEEVSAQDARFEFVMLGLRTVYGVSAQEYRAQFGTDWKEDFAAAYRRTREYLQEEGDVTRIKDEYLFVQNQILSEYAN
ncbi:MAG TPA: radical SAM family heme chaperone HemW [Firmicutes bacterium]|nr:radical SAM family heme chaperone HemW [Bacillota bacterium]